MLPSINTLKELLVEHPLVATAVCSTFGLISLKKYFNGGTCHHDAVRMDGKVVIVTGGSAGIGVETSLDLARRGALVVIATRKRGVAHQAIEYIKSKVPSANVYFLELDLASLDSVREFVKAFEKKEKRLDVLINNAGVMDCPKWQTKDGFEYQFGVNHLGHFLLTNLLLPLLKSSAPSRIINVSSLAHSMGDGDMHFDDINLDKVKYVPWKAYHRSKLANVLFTQELGRRLKGTGVVAHCLHPGAVRTNLVQHDLNHWYSYALIPFLAPFYYLTFKSAAQGAQTSINCAVAPELENVTGCYFKDCSVSETRHCTEEKAETLWDISEKLVGLK